MLLSASQRDSETLIIWYDIMVIKVPDVWRTHIGPVYSGAGMVVTSVPF